MENNFLRDTSDAEGTTNVLIILGIVGSLKTFDIVKLLTGGGPGRSTTVMTLICMRKHLKILTPEVRHP